MIEKKIYYVWVGNTKKPDIFYKCLESWKKNLPDFEIITEGLAGKADHFSEEEQLIVKRLIHTTGDFDCVNIVEFQNNPIESAKEALETGNCRIY